MTNSRAAHTADIGPRRERGFVLAMALVFMLLLMLIAVTAMNTTSLEERMAHNSKDRNLALQASESALVAGEDVVGLATDINSVAPAVASGTDGLHKPSTTGTPVWDNSTTWTGDDNITLSNVGYVASQPKYIIEDLGEVQDSGGSLVATSTYRSRGRNMFRITARGVGGTDVAVVMVQSTYQKRF